MADQILVTLPFVTDTWLWRCLQKCKLVGVLSLGYLLFLSNMISKSGASSAQSIKGEMSLGDSIKFETKAPLPPQQQNTQSSSFIDDAVNIKREGGAEEDIANKEQLIEAKDMDMAYQLEESDSGDDGDDIKQEDTSKKEALGICLLPND